MEKTGKITLIGPAKIGGKRYPVGATPEVTPEIALQLAKMGAIEATPSEIEKARAAISISREHDVEAILPIADLMQGEMAETLKTGTGNWSRAKIAAALGRDVSDAEIKAAETAINLLKE